MLWVTSHRALDDPILQSVENTSSPSLKTGAYRHRALYFACTAPQTPPDRCRRAPGGGACPPGPGALLLAAYVLPYLGPVEADGARAAAPRPQRLVPAGRQARPRAPSRGIIGPRPSGLPTTMPAACFGGTLRHRRVRPGLRPFPPPFAKARGVRPGRGGRRLPPTDGDPSGLSRDQ